MSGKLIYVCGDKGGSTKSTIGHLLCLGAILRREPAAYVLTDEGRKLKIAGRPYNVLDGTKPKALADIITGSRSSQNGWWIIDGGGSRPDLDKVIGAQAQLCLVPFRDGQEDVDAAMKALAAIPNALAWPSAWPTNKLAVKSSQKYIDEVAAAFPLRVITPPINFIHSANELMSKELGDPSTHVRSAARRAFGIMEEYYEARQQTPQGKAALTA